MPLVHTLVMEIVRKSALPQFLHNIQRVCSACFVGRTAIKWLRFWLIAWNACGCYVCMLPMPDSQCQWKDNKERERELGHLLLQLFLSRLVVLLSDDARQTMSPMENALDCVIPINGRQCTDVLMLPPGYWINTGSTMWAFRGTFDIVKWDI